MLINNKFSKGLQLFVFLLCSCSSFSQSGTNNLSFNSQDIGFGYGDGLTVDNPSTTTLVQQDGKVIVSGNFTAYSNVFSNRILRLNADGSVDTSFHIGSGANNSITNCILEPSGKIIICGNFSSFNGISRNRVARLNSNGSLDLSFNPGSGFNNVVYDIKLQSDGKLIVVGDFTTFNGTSRSRIARLNNDGSLDTSFNPGFGANATIYTLFIQPDNKVVIGGSFTFYNNSTPEKLARLNNDGSLDITFSVGSGPTGPILSILPIGASQFLVAGNFSYFNGTYTNNIISLNSDGSINTNFASGIGTNDYISEMFNQPNGKILLAGSFTSYNNTPANKIISLNPDGSQDLTFNTANGFDEDVTSLGFDASNNSYVLAGYFKSYQGVSMDGMIRLSSTGDILPGFDFGTAANDIVRGIEQSSDGEFLISGDFTSYNSYTRNRIAKINSSGTLNTNFDPGNGANNLITSLKIQPDQKILIGGDFTMYDSIPINRIARINSDGSFDETFDPGLGSNGIIHAIAVQSDNKILIGGDFTQFNGTFVQSIVRLNPDGSIDNTFSCLPNATVRTICVQTDGKILIGGYFGNVNGVTKNYLARINPDGSVDNSFGSGPGPGANGFVLTMSMQPDNKIIIGGSFTSYNGVQKKAIARLNADGNLDYSFIGNFNNSVLGIQQLADSNLIVIGPFTTCQGYSQKGIARLKNNGLIDLAFSAGSGLTGISPSTPIFQSVKALPTGDLIAGGSFVSYDGTGRNRITRINNCINTWDTITHTTCDSFLWEETNQTYTSTGLYSVVLNSALGCDSIITLNLTINYSDSVVDSQTACDSLTWIDGVTYTSSTNTPTWTLTNSVGCDSVIILNLIINNSSTGTDVQTSCDSFTWIDGVTYTTSTNTPTWTLQNTVGCDSIVTLDLTINNSTTGTDIQTACDSLVWIDGVTYTASTDSPTFILTNSTGCDSMVTLNLTILNQPTIIENTFSLPSDATDCIGEFAVDISGNGDFVLDIDNGSQTATSSGYNLFTGLCSGVHDLRIINFCGDTTSSQFVIPIDSNYVFNNPFIDSLAQDSLGTVIENCDIYYGGIDAAAIDSIWATGNTVNVIWNIVDSNGSNLDTTTYELNNGNGVYWLQLSVFCPTKSVEEYFTVTEAIYFEDGNVFFEAGISNWEETEVLIYPNPTSNAVNISFEGTEAELLIYDAQGKRIQDRSAIHSGEQVSLANVQTGVYFFELSTSEGKVVKRVVKN